VLLLSSSLSLSLPSLCVVRNGVCVRCERTRTPTRLERPSSPRCFRLPTTVLQMFFVLRAAPPALLCTPAIDRAYHSKPAFLLNTVASFLLPLLLASHYNSCLHFPSPHTAKPKPPTPAMPRFPLLWSLLSLSCLYLSLKWGTSTHSSNVRMDRDYESVPFWKTWQGTYIS